MADDFDEPLSNGSERGKRENNLNGGTPSGGTILSFSERQAKLHHEEGNNRQQYRPNCSNEYQSTLQSDKEHGENPDSPGGKMNHEDSAR